MTYQVFGILAYTIPITTRKIVNALLYALEEKLLTIWTFLPAIPSTVAATLARERALARQHNENYNTETP